MGGMRTARTVHLNQERSYRDLSCGNGQVEEENSDPCEKKEVVQFANFSNDCNMVSETMEDRQDAEDLGDGCEELLLIIKFQG